MNEISMELLIGLSLFAAGLSLSTVIFCALDDMEKTLREEYIRVMMKGPDDYKREVK